MNNEQVSFAVPRADRPTKTVYALCLPVWTSRLSEEPLREWRRTRQFFQNEEVHLLFGYVQLLA